MNINKAFREGHLNRWLYDEINRKIHFSSEVWPLSTLVLVLSILGFFFFSIINSENFIHKGPKVLLSLVLFVFCIVTIVSMVRRIIYCILFSREYRKFYTYTYEAGYKGDFSEFIDQIQYDQVLCRKSVACDILSRCFHQMLMVEKRLGVKYQEYSEWAEVRARFSKIYDLFDEYDLTLDDGWSPYKEKAKTLP